MGSAGGSGGSVIEENLISPLSGEQPNSPLAGESPPPDYAQFDPNSYDPQNFNQEMYQQMCPQESLYEAGGYENPSGTYDATDYEIQTMYQQNQPGYEDPSGTYNYADYNNQNMYDQQSQNYYTQP